MSVVGWILSGGAFAGGLVATGIALRGRSPAASALITVWVVTLFAFAATLPAQPSPPFTAGGQLGSGLLLGSGLWLIATFLGAGGRAQWAAVGLPLLAPSLALLLVPAGPLPMLMGILIAAALAWCCLGRFWPVLPSLAIAQFAFVAALGLVFETVPPKGVLPEVWHLAPVFIAGAGYGAVLTARFTESWIRLPWLGAHLVTCAWLIAGTLAAQVLCGAIDLWQVALAVTVSTSLVGLLAWEKPVTGLALLVWIGVFALVFTADRGYGTALAALMLSLYTVVMASQPTATVAAVKLDNFLSGAALLTLAGLFRLFVESYPLRAPRADLYTHYTLIGVLMAVAVLANLTIWWNDEASPLRTLVVGFWAAGAPVALAAIWGVRAAAGWLGGGLAAALLVFVLAGEKQNWLSSILPLVFTGVAAALPLVALVDPLSDAPRATRVWVLLAIGLGCALSLALEFFFNRATGKNAPGPVLEASKP